MLNIKIFTVWTELDTFDVFVLLCLEDLLGFEADSVELNKVVKGGESKKIHITSPKGYCHFRYHQFFEVDGKLVLVLFNIHSNIQIIAQNDLKDRNLLY